jgi:hypothetical protein
MRHLGVIIALLALSVGGCVLPCGSGGCSTGEPQYVAPAPRFFGSKSRCVESGVCKPKPYVTFTKYWPFLDELHTTWTAKSCAKRILIRQEWNSKRLLGGDYKDGFKQAFIDIAQGGNGEVPAVPPPKFWNTHFRSNWGQRKAELWFNGYRAGVAMAGVELNDIRHIAASADWTVEKPTSPFASQANCETGNCPPTGPINGGSLLNPQPRVPFRSSFGSGQFGSGPSCQTCQPVVSGPQFAPPFGQPPGLSMPGPQGPFSNGPPNLQQFGPPPQRSGPAVNGPPIVPMPQPRISTQPMPRSNVAPPPNGNLMTPGHSGSSTNNPQNLQRSTTPNFQPGHSLQETTKQHNLVRPGGQQRTNSSSSPGHTPGAAPGDGIVY